MSQGLRKVADLALQPVVVFLGQQADVVAQRQSCSNMRVASSISPISARLSTSQNVHGRNVPSPGGSPSLVSVVR